MKLHPDILMYLQMIKKFFNTNVEARKYFIVNDNEELFFNKVIEMSIKNYEKNNDPKLSVEQFEELRMSLFNDIFNSLSEDYIIQNFNLKTIPELSIFYLN